MTPSMMSTISLGTPVRSRICADRSRKAKRSDARATPSGWFRPTSAAAMPAKPSPVGKSMLYR